MKESQARNAIAVLYQNTKTREEYSEYVYFENQKSSVMPNAYCMYTYVNLIIYWAENSAQKVEAAVRSSKFFRYKCKQIHW